MIIIKDIILNIILIMFPILLYFVFTCCQEKENKELDNLLLNISLASSLYLCLKFGTITNNSKILLFCNIPIIIAYMKKKPVTGVILSAANILYCNFMYDILYISTIVKYASYFFVYFATHQKKLSIDCFILSIAVLQGFFLSFEFFFQEAESNIITFFEVFIIVFIYYFVTFFVVYLFKLIDKIKSLNKTIEILEKDKQIKNALFKLTHEIKNPIAVCKGYLEMIDLNKKDKSTKYIDIMREEIERSLNIMSDFMEFNKIKIVKEPIDLNLLLEDTYNCMKMFIKSKNIKLSYSCQDEEMYLMADYERLKQVLINLIKNSFESIDGKGEIKMSSTFSNNYLNIIIEDNGAGMSKESLERITEMFFTTKAKGSGLGVALSNEIIKAHHGELIYDSKLGKGTKVTVKLPCN